MRDHERLKAIEGHALTLGEVVKIERSTADSTALDPGLPYLGLENVVAHGDIAEASTLSRSGVKGVVARYGPSHVLYGKLRPYLNKVVAPEHEGACSTEFLPLLPSKDVDRRYLLHWLRSPAVVEQASRLVAGANLPRLSPSTLLSFEFPCPPLPEQRRIADILDRADALKRKRQQALKLADDFLRASFSQLYQTQGDIEQGWEQKKLIDLGLNNKSIVNGPFGSDLLTSELTDEGVPVVYIRDIREGSYNRISTSCVTSQKAGQLAFCNVFPGDILIAKVGDPPGTAAFYPEDQPQALVTQDVVRMRLNHSVLEPEVLTCWFNSSYGRKAIASIEVEATRSRFSLTQFKQLSIWIPPKDLQESFCNTLRNLRSLNLAGKASERTISILSLSLNSSCFSGSEERPQ